MWFFNLLTLQLLHNEHTLCKDTFLKSSKTIGYTRIATVYGVLTMYQALCYFALWRLIFKKIRHCLDFNGDIGQMAQVLPPKSNDRTAR